MTITGLDTSHFQGTPDFARVKASGRDFVVLKATESTNYTDPTMAANRRAAHAAGLVVGLYHFARAGNAAAEAAWFLKAVGTLQAGEFLVLDWEVSASNPPAWCKQWLDAVYAATGVRPLIYMNQTAATGSNWSALTADYGLWLAKYDGLTVQPTVAGWPAVAMKQYSDKGTVAGVAGTCDVDVFYGTTAQLLAYGTPSGDISMADAQQILDFLQNTTGADLRLLVQKLDGYGQRIERIDEGQSDGKPDPWGYGLRIEAIQTAVAALSTPTLDPAAVAAGLAADQDFINKLADALVKRPSA